MGAAPILMLVGGITLFLISTLQIWLILRLAIWVVGAGLIAGAIALVASMQEHYGLYRALADFGAHLSDPSQSVLAQALERRHHITEHLSDAERFPAARLGDRIVQMEDIDPVEA